MATDRHQQRRAQGSDKQANRIERYRLRLFVASRERELVAWVATGRSNQEVGQALFISPATVRTHVGRAMVKLRAIPRAQLVVFAVQSGLTIPHQP